MSETVFGVFFFFQFPWSNLIFLASSFKFHLFLKFSKFIYIEFPRFIQSRAFDSFAVFFLTTFTYVKAHLFTQLTLIMIFIYGSIVIFFKLQATSLLEKL